MYMCIYVYIYIYIHILESSARFARASGTSRVSVEPSPGPWWGPPLGLGGALPKALAGPLPLALVGPCPGPWLGLPLI